MRIHWLSGTSGATIVRLLATVLEGDVAGLNEQVRARLAAPNFWHLATLNQDGSPHVSPMWLDVEGDYLVFNTAVGRVKEENLRRDPRVSLSTTAADDPYDRVLIRGRVVEFVEGDEAERCMDRLAKKYVGTDRFEWRIPGERRVKILVEPTHVRHVVGVEPFRRGILPEP
jgi:PPOX class probable F420-dependent enzyme